MVRRYPVLTAIALGVAAGLGAIGVLVAVDDGRSDGQSEATRPAPNADAGRRRPERAPERERPEPRRPQQRPAAGRACSSRAASVNGNALRLDLCVSPGTVTPGAEVRFEARARPCEATLDFGDGSSTPVPSEGRVTVHHTYANPGAYTARLDAAACGPGGEIAVTVSVT
jgi:hypothetical protein